MFNDRRSSMRRYADLVVRHGSSYWKVLQYEIVTGLFGGLPGALGLTLRRIFDPLLFRRVGRAPVFGRHLVIRNAHRISLGDRVIIDDGCVLAGRGAGEAGVPSTPMPRKKNDGVLAVREQARVTGGPIRIGDRCLFGMGAMVLDGVEVGERTIVGAGSILTRSLPARAVVAGSPARMLRMRRSEPTAQE